METKRKWHACYATNENGEFLCIGAISGKPEVMDAVLTENCDSYVIIEVVNGHILKLKKICSKYRDECEAFGAKCVGIRAALNSNELIEMGDDSGFRA